MELKGKNTLCLVFTQLLGTSVDVCIKIALRFKIGVINFPKWSVNDWLSDAAQYCLLNALARRPVLASETRRRQSDLD